jgi:hypothetical protein
VQHQLLFKFKHPSSQIAHQRLALSLIANASISTERHKLLHSPVIYPLVIHFKLNCGVQVAVESIISSMRTTKVVLLAGTQRFVSQSLQLVQRIQS